MSDTFPYVSRNHRPYSESSGQWGCYCVGKHGDPFNVGVAEDEDGRFVPFRMTQWYHNWHQDEPAPFSWLGPPEEEE